MIPHLLFYQLVLIALVWVFLMLYGLWPLEPAAVRPPPPKPVTPPRKRSCAPQPFIGPTRKPPCDACEEGVAPRREPPCAPPPLMVSPRGRRRQVDTSQQCCPAPDCRYGGWLGLGNLRANGHPSGGPWRQLHCTSCDGYFLETQGTLFHGKRVSVDRIVHVIGCLAEGLGIRGTARVFEVDPNTVLHWLMEATEQLRAFAQYFLHDLHLTQVQLDELYAVLSALKDGTLPALGVGGDRPGEQVAAGARRRGAHPHDGATRRASGGPGPGPWLYALIPERWLQRVHDSLADALWPLGPASAPPGHRASPQAALDTPARAPLCAGDQDGTPAALGAGEPSGGLRHAGGY